MIYFKTTPNQNPTLKLLYSVYVTLFKLQAMNQNVKVNEK